MRRRRDAPRMLTERVQTLAARRSLNYRSPVPALSPPGTGHLCGCALRGRDREPDGRPLRGRPSGGPALGAPGLAGARTVSRGNARSAAAATLPASTSDETPAPPGRYVITVTTSAPPCQRTMPLSWRADVDPARLVEHADAREPPDLAVDLAGVAHVGEEIEQVARVRGREARLRRRAAARGRRSRARRRAAGCARS